MNSARQTAHARPLARRDSSAASGSVAAIQNSYSSEQIGPDECIGGSADLSREAAHVIRRTTSYGSHAQARFEATPDSVSVSTGRSRRMPLQVRVYLEVNPYPEKAVGSQNGTTPCASREIGFHLLSALIKY